MQGTRAKEPDTAEFISALVAGTNARLMVAACAGAAECTILLALVAAAHQTGGNVVCIVGGANEVQLSKETLGECAADVKFVIGDAETLLASEYREADCIVVDCRINNCEGILKTAKGVGRNNVMVLGYNAFWIGFEFDDAHLLPIGEGLLVSRVGGSARNKKDGYRCGSGKRSRWVVKVDKFTGEEHVFRVTTKPI